MRLCFQGLMGLDPSGLRGNLLETRIIQDKWRKPQDQKAGMKGQQK